ncbi:receptor-interacting serine/threonine-protein kinase 5 [Mytilus galloprovincialis]|uniref:Receptor-interacting serine/threonine-protein kinase 5 n=1 Tax=Mytilus galloprovincialis TaxID=29158 RepID=A0A8B6GCJ6_MYTGA|nr:receptor-interacting serine/threonine-protein kinase 5 [Mytilus galloprovincialis]
MTSLSAELNRFCEFSKRTKQILDETKSCFDDINESGNSELGSLFKAELLREEEQEILDIAQRPPGIVILGQNSYSKFKIVNEIFNNGIFPVINSAGNDDLPFRMVRFKHGESLSYSLALPDDYEIVDHLDAYKEQSKTVPLKDLQIHSADKASDSAILEISYNHVILRQGAQIIVAPSLGDISKVYKTCTESVSPILVYSFSDDLSDEEIETLQNLQEISQYESVCFIRVPKCRQHLMNGENPNNNSTNSTMDTERDNVSSLPSRRIERTLDRVNGNSRSQNHSLIGKNKMTILKNTKVYEQLCDLGYLNENPTCRNTRRSFLSDYYETESDLIDNFESHSYRFNMFVQQTLQRYLVNSSTVLNNSHSRCLSMFIMSAFDMARDMLITPKKLTFAREKEVELYKSLMRISVAKTNEIREMIGFTIAENTEMLVQKAADYEFLGVEFNEDGAIMTHKGLKICTYQLQELVLGALNQSIAGKLVKSVNILRDSYTDISECEFLLLGM